MSRDKKEKSFSFPISTIAGSRFVNFVKASNANKIERPFLLRYILTAIVSYILDFFSRGESLMWNRRIKKTRIGKPPVFIIGFSRSGTTYLHNLLCNDRDFYYISTFQTIFPYHVLSHAGWMKYLAGFLMPEKRPVDNVKLDLELPQEEEIGLANISTLSLYHFFYFPKAFRNIIDRSLFFKDVDQEKIEKWKWDYQYMIKKAKLNKGGNRFISKNPPNTFRIKTILEMFPDARFIYIHREPYKVLQSATDFFMAVIEGIQFQSKDKAELLREVNWLYSQAIQQYEKDKSLIPSTNLIELKYEEFVKDPISDIKEIYNKFGIDGFEDKKGIFQNRIHTNDNYKARQYGIDQEIIRYVNENLTDELEHWGYDKRNN